ncbi:MAG: DNA topoisomerase I, partial [Halobacteriota archaeon]
MSRGPEVIITEKDNAARRIAEILSGDSAEADRMNGVNVYKWGGKRCIGLSGHVVGVDFPPEYNDWRDVEPVELIDAPIDKQPTQEHIVAALRRLARRASAVTIATDYDREGELIGKEAYELVREVNEDVPIDRVRFSSITENEVTSAFESPEDLDFDLAAAGEARQVIDLIWGAALTRFLSLSARQLGNDFISVGRVQGPTLKLIVDREREIEAFDPEDYWELFADLENDADEGFEAQYFYLDADGNEAERLWDGDRAAAVYDVLSAAHEAIVDSVRRRTRTDTPPAPFNTTQFIRAAGSLGYSAQRAMSIAEDLYTAGYITYPRTDNTVYPEDLDPRELLDAFTAHRTFGEDAETLLESESIEPTEGDNETTDHPPIHPTGELPNRSVLSDGEWEIYELVVRRFFATVADPATWEHLRVVAVIPDVEVATDGGTATEDLSLKANGKRLLEEGYHAVYPYFNAGETFVPDVTEGEALAIDDTRIEDKQTQPPRRYGQSRLIETMESMGVGTKSTRHHTIEKLYDRGYVEGDPPRPTMLARSVVEAAERFADQIVSEEMTAQLEADMQAI